MGGGEVTAATRGGGGGGVIDISNMGLQRNSRITVKRTMKRKRKKGRNKYK